MMASPSNACSPPNSAWSSPSEASRLCATLISTTMAAAPMMAARPALATSASTRITSATAPSANPSVRCGANAVSAPTVAVRKAPSPARKICAARSSRKTASAQW